jgi:hypothetical protein
MRIEGLVTCLNVSEWRETKFDGMLPSLLGVFQSLPFIPSEFAVYCDLRPGAFDEGQMRIRCRQRRNVWYETNAFPVRFQGSEVYRLIAWVHDTVVPPGRSVVEVLIAGGVAGSRLIELKP